ncbi:MAG: hypothetical protein WCA29_03630 [Jiangellales bacterium]
MTRTPVAKYSLIQVRQPSTPSVAGPSVTRVLPTRPPAPANLLGSVAPVAVFLLANAAWGLVAGMLASTAAAVVATLARRHRGQQIGWLALALLGYVLIRGAAGAVTGSHQVFFGISVAASMAVAVAVLATAFTRTPLAAYLLPILMRGRLQPQTAASPTYRRISADVTAAWAAAELTVSGWEAWHLQHATALEFVGARGLIGWPVMAGVVFVLAFYARFRIEWLQGAMPQPHPRATPVPR